MLVLDTWPVMEWLYRRQPAASLFDALIAEHQQGVRGLCMSRVNLGEVYYSSLKGRDARFGEALIKQIPALLIEIVPAHDHHVNAAARLKARYKISYADAFAAALSIERHAPLVTGDREFWPLVDDGLLELHWVGA